MLIFKILDSMNGEELTDEEMELIVGGSNGCVTNDYSEGKQAQYACDNLASLNKPWMK